MNTQCTVLELIFCMVLAFLETEAYKLIQSLLFVQKYPHWPLNSRGFTCFIKKFPDLHRRLNLRFQNIKSISQRIKFFSVATFFLYLWLSVELIFSFQTCFIILGFKILSCKIEKFFTTEITYLKVRKLNHFSKDLKRLRLSGSNQSGFFYYK